MDEHIDPRTLPYCIELGPALLDGTIRLFSASPIYLVGDPDDPSTTYLDHQGSISTPEGEHHASGYKWHIRRSERT